MAISANTLFHFTERQRLLSILSGHFSPHYSLEDLSNVLTSSGGSKEAYIPMVCFCDLVFPQIKDHIDFYGYYGIGLRKNEWGIKNGISPIMYVPPQSISAHQIQSIGTAISTYLKAEERNTVVQKLQNFYKYVKPYSGVVKSRKDGKPKKKTFYDEREWRFVPSTFPVLPTGKITASGIQKRDEKMDKSERLTFEAKDVKYIIVKTENEIPVFALEIEKLTRFNKEEQRLLVSKLISVEQINDDM